MMVTDSWAQPDDERKCWCQIPPVMFMGMELRSDYRLRSDEIISIPPGISYSHAPECSTVRKPPTSRHRLLLR